MDFETLIKNPPAKRVRQPIVTTQNSQSTFARNTTDPSDRNLQIALHHAKLLQDRKDIEVEILNSLEELIDFPTSQHSSPAQPNAEDLARFRSIIIPFQISDYDALIEERVAASKCGYVFCPKPLKKESAGGNYMRLVWGTGRGNELKIVPNQKYETWCSKACAKRAMFIKVQLSETPAWDRASASSKTKIEVLRETDVDAQNALQAQMARLVMDDGNEDGTREAMELLASERGESTKSAKVATVMSAQLKENQNVNAPQAPSFIGGQMSGTIEGYLPRTVARSPADSIMEDDEEEDQDWNLP